MSQNNTIVLKSIDELLNESFFIPFYQRGYRWTPRQAKDLLDDLSEFQTQQKEGKATPFYCLQPVVLKRHERGWELIDGQQRLTTLHIILGFLKAQMAPGQMLYQISYETRPGSEDFLSDLKEEKSRDNIDFFHMYEVRKTVQQWFEKRDETKKPEFLKTLLGNGKAGGNVKVIWYQINEETDVAKIFTRLNMGKIPLTNAELVKALLLKRSNFEEQERHLRQLKIAQEWDEIERALQADDFWYFLSGEEREANRIEFVLNLVARDLQDDKTDISPADPSYIFLTFADWFETTQDLQPFQTCWGKIKRWFMILQEWYQEHDLFHMIGFLVASGRTVSSIAKIFAKTTTKKEFRQALKNEIKNTFIKKDENIDHYIRGLTYENRESVLKVLLFFNIRSFFSNPETNARFQFDRYKAQKWDVEHIHSRSDNLPGQRQKQIAWLQYTLDFVASSSMYNLQDDNKRKELLEEGKKLIKKDNFSKQEFDNIAKDIVNFYGNSEKNSEVSPRDWKDSIGNLALLDSKTNRSYQNAIFPLKRQHIIARDESAIFVPLCTKNVFLKYYSAHVNDMLRWTVKDMENYQNAIIQTFTEFFTEPGAAA